MPKLAIKSIPFPNLPLPSKYSQIRLQKLNQSISETKINPPPPPSDISPQVTDPKQYKTSEINIDEPQIGGILDPEPDKIHDKDSYVIEELDYRDYAS